MENSRDYFAERMQEQREDLATKKALEFKLELTDKQAANLELKALKAGFRSGAELLESFIGDLTGWSTNGSDEERMADEWYERAFGMSTEFYAFFRYHCYNYEYDIEDLIESLEDDDLFDELYQEYVNENSWPSSITLQSKEECRKVIEELTADERATRAEENKKVFDILNQEKYEKMIIARFDDEEYKVNYQLGKEYIEVLDDVPLPEGVPYRSIENMVETDKSITFDWLLIKWEILVK